MFFHCFYYSPNFNAPVNIKSGKGGAQKGRDFDPGKSINKIFIFSIPEGRKTRATKIHTYP